MEELPEFLSSESPEVRMAALRKYELLKRLQSKPMFFPKEVLEKV